MKIGQDFMAKHGKLHTGVEQEAFPPL